MGIREHLHNPQTYMDAFERIYDAWIGTYKLHKAVKNDVFVRELLFKKEEFTQTLADSIKNESFQFSPLQLKKVKIRDKYRDNYPLTFVDFLVQTVLCDYLMIYLEPKLSDNLYSFRKSKSRYNVFKDIIQYFRQHYKIVGDKKQLDLYCYQADIANYVESIPVDESAIIWDMLEFYFIEMDLEKDDAYLRSLYRHTVRPQLIDLEGKVFRKTIGIPFGSPMSNILYNFYVHELDYYVSSDLSVFYCRYADDLMLIHPDAKVIEHHAAFIKDFLASRKLKIHEKKEEYTYLTIPGRPSTDFPKFKPAHKVSILGNSIAAEGTINIKKGKLPLVFNEFKKVIYNTHRLNIKAPRSDLIKAICSIVNQVLVGHKTDIVKNEKLQDTIRIIDDRQNLKQLDYLIALEIAKTVTGIKGLAAFRQLPYKDLRTKYGLCSAVRLKNKGVLLHDLSI
ncbi:MAG TPA: reverse transcriptase domain-containing protein [Gammaproteobacteria bacterium]|nr:reverse transcriptase domain-containing protein [Gammaproteobacteria bacterium]